METLLKDFKIKAKYKDQFDEKLAKLNSKAAKMNLQPYTCSYGQAIEENGELILPISLLGVHSVKFDGWEFAATLNHTESGDVLVFSCSDIPIPEKFKTSECEHCNISRFRKQTYVLFNKDENKYIQVGSTCIKDFFNGTAPENILKFTDIVSEIRNYIFNINNLQSNKEIYFLTNILAMTNATIRDYGWVSKSKSDFETPTALRVLSFVRNEEQSPTLTAYDYEIAKEVMLWMSSLTEKDLESNYLHNLKVIYDSGFVDTKTIGLAVSMIVAYNNSKPKEIKHSEYFGQVGEKRVLELKFKKNFEFFSKFGIQHIYTFEDSNGNDFVWRTTTFKPFEEGNYYIIRASIKAHSLYKEKYKQTEITRCKVEQLGEL